MSGEKKISEETRLRLSALLKEEMQKFLAENRKEIVRRAEKRLRDEAKREDEQTKLP